MTTKRIDKIGDEFFFGSFLFDDFFFVFDDDFVISDFDNFVARDSKLWVDEGFDGGALDDDLLDDEIFGSDGEIDESAELGAFFGLYFENEWVEIELEDVLDFDDVVVAN